MKYSVGMTISQELAQCFQKMRPFSRVNGAGKELFPVLSIDVAIKHVDVKYQLAPLQKKTSIDHAAGKIKIALPKDISGYHAHAILMGGRGLQMISRVAYEADHKEEGVCVSSPSCFAGYLYDLWACLHDYLSADIELDAFELLLKELRLTAKTNTGRKVARFESMAAHRDDGLSLVCSDTGMPIDSEESLQAAISYRVKKAAVNSVCIHGIEARLRQIYVYCSQETAFLGCERHVDRPMPNTISYGSFAEAVRDVALSFELSESGAVVFGDVSNKSLMSHDMVAEMIGGLIKQPDNEAQEEKVTSSSSAKHVDQVQYLGLNNEYDSSQLEVDRKEGKQLKLPATGVCAEENAFMKGSHRMAASPLGSAKPARSARISYLPTPRPKPRSLSVPASSGQLITGLPAATPCSYGGAPGSVLVAGVVQCGIRVPRSGQFDALGPSGAYRRQPSIVKNAPSGNSGRRGGRPIKQSANFTRKPPSSSGIIQSVHNLRYLHFECSKTGRVLGTRAPP